MTPLDSGPRLIGPATKVVNRDGVPEGYAAMGAAGRSR